jgi:adenylate cyclase
MILPDDKLSTGLPTGRYDATVLFCDIRGFTALFDQRDPLEALGFANSVLAVLGDAVELSGGVIDKFTGDGFLAYFGVPSQANHAENACRAALRMRATLSSINNARYGSELPVISIGIGIHSGPVAAGVIATKSKSEYTVLGSTVNLASRIEGLTKFFGVDCLLSETTEQLLKDTFLLQKMPPRALRGVTESIGTSWLLPMNE